MSCGHFSLQSEVGRLNFVPLLPFRTAFRAWCFGAWDTFLVFQIHHLPEPPALEHSHTQGLSLSDSAGWESPLRTHKAAVWMRIWILTLPVNSSMISEKSFNQPEESNGRNSRSLHCLLVFVAYLCWGTGLRVLDSGANGLPGAMVGLSWALGTFCLHGPLPL